MEPVARDFRRLQAEGHRRGWSWAIGRAFCETRDAIARGLIRLRVTPNMLTIGGFFATCGAAVCLFLGGSGSAGELGAVPYTLIAAAFFFLAGAADMLDGAVAHVGRLESAFGEVLDSVVDRCSDMVIYAGLIGHFLIRGNLTYAMLAVAAMSSAVLIGYVKARSEVLIPSCSVGYWMRGERIVALLIASVAGNIPAALWQQAILPVFTVIRRMAWVRHVLSAEAAGRPVPTNTPAAGWRGLCRPWRYPRGSLPYDLVTGANIAFLVTAPYISSLFGPEADPLRRLLRL